MVNGDLAIDHHKRQSRRELARVVEGGVVYDPFGVEHRNVCIIPLLDPSPASQTEPLRRTFGHPMHHLFEVEDAVLPTEPPQESGERSE